MNRFTHFELATDDLEKTVDFYRDVFGFAEIGRDLPRHVFLRAGSDVLLLFNAAATRRGGTVPAHGGSGEQHIAFDVPDDAVDAWRQQLEAVGVPIESEVTWPSGGRSLYVRDPDRHSVELVTRGTWGQTSTTTH